MRWPLLSSRRRRTTLFSCTPIRRGSMPSRLSSASNLTPPRQRCARSATATASPIFIVALGRAGRAAAAAPVRRALSLRRQPRGRWRPHGSHSRRHVKAFYRSMGEPPSKANAVPRVLRLILAFAVDEGLLQRNPAERQSLKSTPPRQQVWSLESIQTFVGTAKDAGRPSPGLAVLPAANLGQRQGDILRLSWSRFKGSRITLRQSKTGVLLAVPDSKEMRTALDETPRHSPTILLCETTKRT